MQSRRRSIFFAVMLVVCSLSSLQAQLRVAAVGGGNISAIPMTINGVELEIYDPRFGFHAGLAGEWMFSRRFGLSSGLTYFNSGANINPDKYMQGIDLPEDLLIKGYVNMHSVELPLFAKLNFDMGSSLRYYFKAGGFISYSLAANQHLGYYQDGESLKLKWTLFEPKIEIMGETESNVYMQQRFNSGIALETGVEISKQVTVGTGFRYVLNNMAAYGVLVEGGSVKPNTHMWTLLLSLGYFL